MNKTMNEYLWMDEYIEISYESDICFHIDRWRLIEWRFEFNGNKKPYVIVIEDVRQSFDERFWQSTNMEIATDRNAAFRFSRLRVFIPLLQLGIPFDNLEWFYWKYYKNIINDFIDSYRLITGRFQIWGIESKEDMREFTICHHKVWESSSCASNLFMSSTWWSLLRANRTEEEISNIHKILMWEEQIGLEEIFYMNAVRLFKDNHKQESLIILIITIEIITKRYLLQQLWSDEKVSDYMRSKKDWLKEIIRCIDEDFFWETLKDKVKDIATWIKLRNDIVHSRKSEMIEIPDLWRYLESWRYLIDSMNI